jgi:hypothetical protein
MDPPIPVPLVLCQVCHARSTRALLASLRCRQAPSTTMCHHKAAGLMRTHPFVKTQPHSTCHISPGSSLTGLLCSSQGTPHGPYAHGPYAHKACRCQPHGPMLMELAHPKHMGCTLTKLANPQPHRPYTHEACGSKPQTCMP